ncbi:MAG: YkgJ family cysteine cluster protein [Acidimicrobiales bacterium]
MEPDEYDTLSHIPAGLAFPAPRRPAGHVVLGYDEGGHCPMLVDGGCSIYEHRPRTCRTYDCRVFPAAGVAPEGDDKILIARQARRWRFSYGTQAGQDRHHAVRAAATFLAPEHRAAPSGRNANQRHPAGGDGDRDPRPVRRRRRSRPGPGTNPAPHVSTLPAWDRSFGDGAVHRERRRCPNKGSPSAARCRRRRCRQGGRPAWNSPSRHRPAIGWTPPGRARSLRCRWAG